jgi:DNA-binding NtrC family response regulator
MSATILIVDDEPHLLRLLVRIFEREGYRVLSTDAGDAALETFAAHEAEIDALVLDVIIPPRGGGEVLDAVLARRPGIGVVLASGDQLPEDMARTLAGTRGRFLRKPFLPSDLVESVRAVCAESSDGAS